MGFMSHNGNHNDIIIDNSAVGNPSSEISCRLLLAEANNNNNINEMGLKKGPWTAAEDRILMDYVSKHGEGNWNAVQRNSGLKRCGKSCRLRWANHLRPNLKKGQLTAEEERLILELHDKYGNKWARMASQLPGRTDNEIKNYWNTRVKKRLRKGLPLYPQDINPSSKRLPRHSYSRSYDENTMPHIDTSDFTFQSQPSSSSQNQNLYQFSTLNNNNHSLIPPLYDHHDLTTSMLPSFNFPNPSPISPNKQRKSSILRASSSMPDIVGSYQYFSTETCTNSMYDISSSFQSFQPHTTQTTHLPSSSTQVVPSDHDRSSSGITNFDVNVTSHSSDGFLEQLLQEAERFGFGNSREHGDQLDNSSHHETSRHAFDGYDHSLASNAMHNSLLEMKPTYDGHEQMNNSIPNYLEILPNSNDGESLELTNSSLSEMKLSEDLHEHTNSLYTQILGEVIQFQPSYGMVPNSYNNGESATVSNADPSGVTDDSLEIDMQHYHMNSLFPVTDIGTNTYLG